MNFILTKFIYPIEKMLEVFDGYYFDNPRTFAEIKYVADFIRKASPFPPNDKAVGEDGYITIDYMLDVMKEKYGKDSHVTNRVETCKYKDAFYKMASMWVILRLKEKNASVDYYFDEAEKVRYRMDTLTLLAFKKEYFYDFSVLISGEFCKLYKEKIVEKTKNSIIEALVEFTNDKKVEKEKGRFYGFLNYYQGICKINNKIENNPNKQMLEYIMESLQILRKKGDLKMKFVSIVSIIELLLTHCPETSRFNIEDSISRQFKNKIALICYLRNKKSNYEMIIKESNMIYSLRSDIAHGNFSKFEKDLTKYFEFCSKNNYLDIKNFDKTETLNVLISRTIKYMIIIFDTYLNDWKLLDIIKKV